MVFTRPTRRQSRKPRAGTPGPRGGRGPGSWCSSASNGPRSVGIPRSGYPHEPGPLVFSQLINSVHTRCIVKTSVFTRGVCKFPEKWTFLSLAFYNALSLDTFDLSLLKAPNLNKLRFFGGADADDLDRVDSHRTWHGKQSQ